MTTKTTYDDTWLRKHALYPCDFGCDYTFRPDDLRILDGKLICSYCYDDAYHYDDPPTIDWWALPELPDFDAANYGDPHPMTNPPRAHIYAAIDRERTYQDHKYGGIKERWLAVSEYHAIALEELNESIRALPDKTNALAELLQVAAVCIAAIEAHGLIERNGDNHYHPA